MPIVVKSPQAREDIIEIWQYIAQDSSHNATRFMQEMDERIDLLEEMPRSSPVYRRNKKLRFLAFHNYLIFYRPLAEGIEIIRILHAARDINRVTFT